MSLAKKHLVGACKRYGALFVGAACVLADASHALAADRPTAGAVTAERLKLPSGPNSVRGLADEPQVDPFSAQVDYQVPIELPNGFGGLTPNITLTYSGQLGNGPLGIGWSLSHAKIARSTRLGVPKYQATDELEITGIASGRLVSNGNGQYRVEGMGQTVRIVPSNGGFEIDDGKGMHYKVGTSPASRQEVVVGGVTRTLAWLVESETNAMGETVTFSYTHDQNQVYLSSISWGPGGCYQLALGYEARPDVSTSYRAGFAVTTAQRLKTLTLTSFGVERREYTLSYQGGGTGPGQFSLSRLSGVASTGENRDGAWPSLAFTYAQPSAPNVQPIAGIGTWRLNAQGVSLVDLDGDGASDLLMAPGGTQSYRLNQNGTFVATPQTISGTTAPLSGLQLQDVDGDSRPELLVDGSDGWAVYKWSKTKWMANPSVWPGSKGIPLKNPSAARFADLNGDGVIDAMTWTTDGVSVAWGTPTGILAPVSVGKIGGTALPDPSGRFQDVNGDGIDDYTVVTASNLLLYVGHGDGTFEPVRVLPYPFANNGTVSAADVELADLDRDGLVDLIHLENGQVRWFRGAPDGSFSSDNPQTVPNPETTSATVTVAVADSNGNGSQDIIWSSPNNMWRLDLAGPTTAGMLTEVTNGLGLDVTLSYQSSHALEIAALNAGAPWTSFAPIAIPVPVQKTTSLGAGETVRQVNYSVRDPFWDATEQRFGGFLSTIVTTSGATAAQKSVVTTRYNMGVNPDRELRGRPNSVTVQDGTGKTLSFTVNKWATMVVSGLPDTPLARRAILQDSSVTYFDVTPSRKTDVTYTYDAFGRASHIVDSGRTDLTGDESVKDITYADDDTTWIRDQVCEEKVSDTGGHVLTDVQHFFGDDQTENALCVVGKGWPRETKAYLDTTGRFVSQTASTYDSHGNVISTTTGGVTRHVAYDSNGLFPIEERVTAPSGNDLVWSATWDNVLGVMKTMTDPNGHTTTIGYDSLGREVSVALDGNLPHQVIEYDLTPPFPKTTTWTFDGAASSITAKPDTWSASSGWRQTVEVRNGLGEVRYDAVRLAGSQWIVSNYHEVDANGRVVFAGRPVFSSVLELPSRPTGVVGDTLAYDPLGRLIEQDLPTGAKRTYSYVAFERTVQDADLAPVHSVLDGAGRAIMTERSLPDGTHEIVQASYDAAGRMTTMTLSGGTVTRTFAYDSLGRLTQSHDPDLGTRTLTWDDGNRLLSETNAAGQTIRYTYDSLGRLSTRDTGSLYTFHYDAARPGATGPLDNLAGQLAWTEEPTGGVDVGYDAFGHPSFTRRRIDDRVSEATTHFAPSGLPLDRTYDDGFSYTYAYDPAARLTGIGDLWSALDVDAAGGILHERTKNGVDTTYHRDSLDLVSEVTIKDVDGVAIYDVSATRNASTEITAEVDQDGIGLDHSATFTYDGFARLTGATIGSGSQASTFGYSYDVLHNMTSRTGPATVGAMFGAYHYGEHGRAPRQLTSVTDANGAVTHTFDFDAAGRQIAEDALRISFDASDRVTQVTGLAQGSGTVTHAYGVDGERVKTIEPDGSAEYFFGDGTAERYGVREHDVTAGDRVIARVTMGASSQATGGTAAGFVRAIAPWGAALVAFVLAGLGLLRLGVRRSWRRRAEVAAAIAVTID